MSSWTEDDYLRFDIGLALARAPVRGLRKALTEEDRAEIAKAIVTQLRMAGWHWSREEREIGPSFMARALEAKAK